MQSKGLSRVFSNTTVQKHQFFGAQLSLLSDSQHLYMTTGKAVSSTRWTFVDKVMPLLFKMRSRLVIAFLPRSKRVLISWLQSPSAVLLEPKNTKFFTVSIVSPSICHEVMGLDWRRKWQSTPVFSHGEFHGQRSLVGYSQCGCKESGHDWETKPQEQYLSGQ